MPLATSSPRVMPPKMLMKTERTLSSWLITSSAAAITSALAPPPMSRKFDAAPPTWLTTSSVDIASPAPLAMMPTEPSRPMYWRSFSLAIRSRSSSTCVAAYSAHSGWRNAAFSSRLTLASRACTTPSSPSGVGLRINGLISARSQSPEVKHSYSSTRMLATPSIALSGMPASTAAWRAASALSPSTGLMWSLTMASGAVAATSSMSTPPLADSISRCILAARSSVKLA